MEKKQKKGLYLLSNQDLNLRFVFHIHNLIKRGYINLVYFWINIPFCVFFSYVMLAIFYSKNKKFLVNISLKMKKEKKHKRWTERLTTRVMTSIIWKKLLTFKITFFDINNIFIVNSIYYIILILVNNNALCIAQHGRPY